MSKAQKNVRLSNSILPIKYDIEMKPDLKNFTFSGVETIDIKVLKSVSSITLHSKEIDIETAKINGKYADKITYNKKDETVTLFFANKIPAGRAKLTLVFQGILNDKMRGFYRSSYTLNGKTEHIATTQFEATDARRAFPCFDEPAYKAVFDVSLVVPKGKTAISNTLPISRIEHEAGFEVVKFSPTPKMSTYLLAFIVGDFEYIEKKSKSGVLVRVYTTEGKSTKAGFSLDCAVRVLDFYEKYFDIKYPLPTLDMIAIPDFASLAMENWGAVTYREIGLLVDEDKTSLSSKQMIALVIAHELAHQWFGNLVTMEWWTHLWLNEGFASYIEYLAVDDLFPEWDIWTQFAAYDQGTALRLDSLANTHPIEVAVHHPDEIGEIFDEVSYSKGSSVIKMLAEYLGNKNFRDGLRYYLKKHSYKNTETIHLWQAFEKISKKPVAKVMKNWTSREGYPVVSAENKTNKTIITQRRFFLSKLSKQRVKDSTKWHVPISFVQDNKKGNLSLTQRFESLNETKSWIKLNINESGFYRTAYDPGLLKGLYSPVKEKALDTLDRLGIVRDLFALAEAGVINTVEAIKFLSAYRTEESYIIWLEIAGGIAKIDQLLSKSADQKTKEKLNKFVQELFSVPMKKLGWKKINGESHTETLLRPLIISRLGRAGDKNVIKEVKRQFTLMLKNSSVDSNLRGAIYTIVAYYGGDKEYRTLVKLYKNETLHEEKNRIGGALGDFRNEKVLMQVADFSISKDVRPQDTTSIISSVAINPLGRDIWLCFIAKNWSTLVSRYGDGGHTLGRLLKAISNTPEKKHLEFLRTFFKTHPAPGAKRSVEQVLERIENNVAWLDRDGKEIKKYLLSIAPKP
jgi:puromycin-sensitive aminopeptidase